MNDVPYYFQLLTDWVRSLHPPLFAKMVIERLTTVKNITQEPALQHVCVIRVIPTTKRKPGNEIGIQITFHQKNTCRPRFTERFYEKKGTKVKNHKTLPLLANFSLNS